MESWEGGGAALEYLLGTAMGMAGGGGGGGLADLVSAMAGGLDGQRQRETDYWRCPVYENPAVC
jgi:hypothetical protein